MSTDPAETRVDTTIIPAVTGTRQPISCGGCGEVFACAAFGGAGLFLAETLRAAALAAGWQQDGDAWTCTVCLAKADAEPEPEPGNPPHRNRNPPRMTPSPCPPPSSPTTTSAYTDSGRTWTAATTRRNYGSGCGSLTRSRR